MQVIKSTKIEALLLFITGISIPLINLRINMKFYSISMYMISLLLLMLYLLVVDSSFRRKLLILNIEKQEIAIYFFILCLLFSLFHSTNQVFGIQRLIKILISVMFYIVITKILINKPYYISRIMFYATKAYPIYVIYLGYFYLFKFNVNYLGVNTNYATGVGKNSLAFMASIVLAFSIVDIFDNIRFKRNICYTLLNLVTIISVLLIQSRGLFLVFTLYIIVYFLITSKKISLTIRLLVLFSCIAIVIMVAMPDYLIESSINRFSAIGAVLMGEESTMALSEGRTYLLKRSLDLFLESPFIGIGTGSFMYYGGFETLISHNDYLLVMAEQGIIGVVIFVLLITFFLKLAYTNYKNEKSITNKSLLMSMIGIMFYFVFINAYDNILVWTVFAMISSTNKRFNLYRKNV